MTITFAEALGKHDISLPDEALADLEVPVLVGVPQRQGDVAVIPRPAASAAELATMQRVPPEGIAVVRGESSTGGNSHILDAYHGYVFWGPANDPDNITLLGVLHVPEGSVAYLTHTDEHNSNGIGAGTWTIRGKRTQMDEERRVAD